MSKVIAVTGMVLLAIVLLNTSSPAAPANSLVSRVAALESLVLGQVLAPELTVVRGDVSYDGTIIAGDGFRVSKDGDGDYRVFFDSGTFSDRPTTFVNGFGNNPSDAWVDSSTDVGFRVLTTSGANHTFRFIAIGPR